MLGKGLEDGLANPPDGVGDEFEAAGTIEALGGNEEADVADIDEVGQRKPEILILLGDSHDETQIRLYQF